jgi:ribosomal protein S18 acetylase RimI-like enzyme
VIDRSAVEDNGLVLRTNEPHEVCLHGHRLEYAGAIWSFNQHLGLDTTACALCSELHLDRRAWLVVDHTRVRRADEPVASTVGAEFVLFPPRSAAGIGEIRLVFDRVEVARVRLQMCHVDRRGVIAHVEVAPAYHRRRMATILIACAMSRGPRFQWSTVPVVNTLEARAFCASLMTGRQLQLGEPQYCSHMALANDDLG